MKVLIILFTALFLTMGCTKTKLCDTGKVAAGLIATQISSQLECKNVDAVRADIEEKLVDLKICEKPATQMKTLGSVGTLICGPVVDGLTGGLLAQIPSKWECTGGKVTEELKLKLLAECLKAL